MSIEGNRVSSCAAVLNPDLIGEEHYVYSCVSAGQFKPILTLTSKLARPQEFHPAYSTRNQTPPLPVGMESGG